MDRKVVWIIDDEIDLAETYADFLSDGFVTRVFGAANEVLAAVSAGEVPDLFVTDMNMPGMNGIELIKELRNRKIDKGVIVVSGDEEKNRIHLALQVGALLVIQKPFERKHFCELVTKKAA